MFDCFPWIYELQLRCDDTNTVTATAQLDSFFIYLFVYLCLLPCLPLLRCFWFNVQLLDKCRRLSPHFPTFSFHYFVTRLDRSIFSLSLISITTRLARPNPLIVRSPSNSSHWLCIYRRRSLFFLVLWHQNQTLIFSLTLFWFRYRFVVFKLVRACLDTFSFLYYFIL